MRKKKLIIQKPHKGNTIVPINRADYIFKIKSILKDTYLRKLKLMRVKYSTI